LLVLSFAVCLVVGNDEAKQLQNAESVLASLREGLYSMLEEARNSYIGSESEKVSISSRDNRRQNPTGCLGQNQNGILSCKTCDIRGVFLNTTSVTKPVDSIPGGTMTMTYFDQFNNRPANQFRRVVKVSIYFNSQVCQFFNYVQMSQCPSSGNPSFRPDTSVLTLWIELTGIYSSPRECNFWFGNCRPSCVDKSQSMNLCENPLAPPEDHCNMESLQGGRDFTFSDDCQYFTFNIGGDDASSSSSSGFSSSSSVQSMENPIYKRQSKAITPP